MGEHFFGKEWELVLASYSSEKRWYVIAIKGNETRLIGLFEYINKARKMVQENILELEKD